jgi:hypothetical protein
MKRNRSFLNYALGLRELSVLVFHDDGGSYCGLLGCGSV